MPEALAAQALKRLPSLPTYRVGPQALMKGREGQGEAALLGRQLALHCG